MTSSKGKRRVAVIGAGPRALGALEALARRIGPQHHVEVDLFDPFRWPGAGPNFDPDQDQFCLLNIPIRSIGIRAPSRQGAQVGTFRDWLGDDQTQAERFPPRAVLGRYLHARWKALVGAPPPGLEFRHHFEAATRVKRAGPGWLVFGENAELGHFDEVLLTVGQPDTAPDPQLARWQGHAERCGADLVPAYPVQALLDAARNWTGRPVAIRGMGLSTLDVLAVLTQGSGGHFAKGRYCPSGREPAVILPFSLDGHAAVPKPANAGLDARFDPWSGETTEFGDSVLRAMTQRPAEALDTICESLRPPTLRILKETGGKADPAMLDEWIRQEQNAPGTQESRTPTEALRGNIAEATGEDAPSVGFVVGQLMRKWQDQLRRSFNAAPAMPDTAAAIIGFDEALKRYSYGPPVSSAAELLILIDSGLVDPRAADDPDIELAEDGWNLIAGDRAVRVEAMIDAVLPSPDLTRLADPLIRGLADDGRATVAVEGMGARILPDGQLVGRSGEIQLGLCLLGRLALGSVIAVDSIHDCFGAAADRWADAAVSRL